MKQLNLLLFLKVLIIVTNCRRQAYKGIYKNHSLPRERLKTILKGSHGHIGISFDIGKPNRLVFCESFVDLMSYYELHQQSLSDVRLVSMEGLKRSIVAYQTLRLIAEENQKLEFWIQ